MGRIIELSHHAAHREKAVAAQPGTRENPRTGAERVYEALRHQIMCLELAPGSALDETQLCKAFKVSRTPVREALIRLASEGLAELNPNRGARVSAIDFVDVVDHYEAMDIFLPVACHFAAVRRTASDLATIKSRLAGLRAAVALADRGEIISCNYDLHAAIAAACHNRCIERGYRQMLADKQRLAQHGLPGTAFDKGNALADRFRGTAKLSGEVVAAITRQDAVEAGRLGRALNDFVRSQVIDVLSASLGKQLEVPFAEPVVAAAKAGKARLTRAKKTQP